MVFPLLPGIPLFTTGRGTLGSFISAMSGRPAWTVTCIGIPGWGKWLRFLLLLLPPAGLDGLESRVCACPCSWPLCARSGENAQSPAGVRSMDVVVCFKTSPRWGLSSGCLIYGIFCGACNEGATIGMAAAFCIMAAACSGTAGVGAYVWCGFAGVALGGLFLFCRPGLYSRLGHDLGSE